MIVQLTCFTSWCQNDTIFSTGELNEDSIVCLPINTIRIANSKMIELKYEKEINDELKCAIENDSAIIETLSDNIQTLEKEAAKKDKKLKNTKTQRDIAIGTTSGAGIACLVLILLICLL